MIFEMLRPVHGWIWRDAERRAHKLLRFGETETDGGRDLVRAGRVQRLLPVTAAPDWRELMQDQRYVAGLNAISQLPD